jgi:hypothetical protein
MVHDHLRFEPVAALRLLAEFDEPLGVEQRVRVSFRAARVPREIDQETAENLFCTGPRRLRRDKARSGRPELRALLGREIELDTRPLA